MNQTPLNTVQEEWLKILGKGMVTIPKQWREELKLQEGDIVKAKKMGNKVMIEPQQSNLAPYRVYSAAEINTFLKEDKLPVALAKKVDRRLSALASK